MAAAGSAREAAGARLERGIVGTQPCDLAGQHAEPTAAAFLAALEQHLQPEADAEVRRAGRDTLAQHVAESTFGETAHEHAECALPWHDELVRFADHFGIARDHDIRTDVRQRTLDGAQVAGTDVEDRDHSVSVPLVEGIAPPRRGSIRVAASHARANALKMHSIM